MPTYTFQVAAATGVITPGMFVKWSSNGSPYVIPCVDADNTIGTDTAIVGLTASTGTHTASADGVVDVYLPLPGIIYRGYAKTAGSVAATLVGDRIVIDVSATTAAGDWTFDESAGEGQTNSFCIIGVDTSAKTVDCILRHGATFLGDQDLS